jgi:hypothetical protein
LREREAWLLIEKSAVAPAAMSRSKPHVSTMDPGPYRVSEPLARARQRLLELGPGGSRANPLEVSSAAVIEPKAESTPCPRCSAHFVVEEHDAHLGSQRVRELKVHCRFCDERRSLWFRINEPS